MDLNEDYDHIKNVCKLGKGVKCCKYLVGGAKGLECMRIDEANKKVIDDNWNQVEHIAQGDNCRGYNYR